MPIPSCQFDHVFDPGAYSMHIRNYSCDAAGGINISERRIFPTGNEQRKVLLGRGHHPTVCRVDLIEFFEPAFPQNLEKEFMREKTLLARCSSDPFLNYKLFDPPDSLLFRDARIRHPVQMPRKQFLLLLRRQLPIIRDALILAARDEIEKVLL